MIEDRLGSGEGMRVASIDVDFDPFDFARTGAALVDRAVAYASPEGDRVVGLGTAWHASSAGADRFDDVQRAIAALQPEDLKVFVGYAFHDVVDRTSIWTDFSAIDAFVPRIAIEGAGDRSRLTVTIPPGQEPGPTLELLGSMRRPAWVQVVETGDHTIESHPHVSRWAQSVADAVKVIESGALDKVVLARAVRVESSEPVPILRVFRQLVRSYPGCYNFAWKSFGSVLMGASPELLAEVRGSSFRSNPLAGSARRGEGTEDDRLVGDALLASTKDREEHRLVVDDVVQRLSGLVDDIVVPATPELRKMATVQHLSTEITGSARAGVLGIVDRLHPTPAVGGVPRTEAVAYIDETEEIERGWYTGGIGWVTPSGDGTIAIALRCGLVSGATTELFAGAGIVADSDPAAEVEETRLKLRPLLDIVAAT